MVLTYFTYYVAPLMVALFTKGFHKPAFWIITVFHFILYYLIFGRGGANATEYHLYLPLIAIFGLLNGVVVSKRLNLRRPIFKLHWQNFGFWVPFAILQLAAALAILVFWEMNDAFPRPWGGIITFFAYVLIIPLFHFMSRGFDVWSYYCQATRSVKSDDNSCRIFYSVWGLFQLSAVLIFGIFDWAWPNVWGLWVALGVAALHLAFILVLEAIKIEYNWKSAYIRHSPKKWQFSVRWNTDTTPDLEKGYTPVPQSQSMSPPSVQQPATTKPQQPIPFTTDYNANSWNSQ